MILAFDTYYYDDKAKTVCVQFDNWTDKQPTQVYSEIREGVEEYVPGEFYKRELPCILGLLNSIPLDDLEIIIVDGFVILDNEGKLGLGGYLYESLERKYPIVGVGKTNFAQITRNKIEVLRGESIKPLFVTSLGMDVDIAAEHIRNMYGMYRMPDLLKLIDTLTKDGCK